ncbi:hypothetical protein H6G17_26410 [Chroococcidiopsis sp. FACHB-1243]|uniref:hypothetical protein n=1 Tax=Chroococcidiopsis sp. [FACHB-1243] TaxID=2692781 RepID=UPI001783C047|nr:hypothetical protein [Chroococcidiopsis sp. [FACHB-1243]]MBD2309000.1 hypothetical protein [Chroococcidiopsis sp. [FACHB-1243]]
MLEDFESKVKRMPLPKVIQVSNSQLALTLNENLPVALTLSWQQVLVKISEALIAGNSVEVLKLLFCHLDYIQLNHNAVNDLCYLVRQPVEPNAIREIDAQLDSLKNLMDKYLKHPQTNTLLLNHLIHESSFVIQQLKSLDIVGVGALMLASGFRLALLLQLPASNCNAWNQIKLAAIEDSDYASGVTPKLFRLTVGQIDKSCQCIRWSSASEFEASSPQYECRYFDGKDVHLFRASSLDAGFECNKHRLLMFRTVVDRVNQTAARPVRSAIKKWRLLAASIQENYSTTEKLTRRVLVSAD